MNCKLNVARFVSAGCVLLFLLLIATSTQGGVDYADPTGGWTYKFEGDSAASAVNAALDGTWDHDNPSDAWDGSEIESGSPGGISAVVEDGTGVTFIRIQDPGDPRDYEMPDPSNRKIFLDRDIIGLDDLSETFLDDGFTFSFRARLATPNTGGPLDDWYPDGGAGPDEWPDEGLGYAIHDNGTAHISFYQPYGVGGLGFALATPREDRFVDGTGLLMNDLIADFPDANAGSTGNGEVNLLEIEDLTAWHEFWITIQLLEDGDGTHLVNVYMDGSTEPDEFVVTASTRADMNGDRMTQGPMSIGVGATPLESAWDLDFIAYIPGVIEPTVGVGVRGDYNGNGMLDLEDIDILTAQSAAGTNLPQYDLTGDGLVDGEDVKLWAKSKDVGYTWIGDANYDGQFNTGDFVRVLGVGKYENQNATAVWSEGDWNGDGSFDTGDLVAALSDGGYEVGPRSDVSAVPEPGSLLLLLLGLIGLAARRR